MRCVDSSGDEYDGPPGGVLCEWDYMENPFKEDSSDPDFIPVVRKSGVLWEPEVDVPYEMDIRTMLYTISKMNEKDKREGHAKQRLLKRYRESQNPSLLEEKRKKNLEYYKKLRDSGVKFWRPGGPSFLIYNKNRKNDWATSTIKPLPSRRALKRIYRDLNEGEEVLKFF